ncbi:snoRNA-binding rRNA-processing protein utp10, partial [Ascosphaera atra]
MLDAARSGRTEVERRNKEDILLRVLPILHDGLALTNTPDMIVGCYMLCIVIATKGNLDDKVLDGLTEAISGSLSPETFSSGLTSLSILVQHKEERTLPANVIKALSRAENLLQLLSDAKQRRSTDALVHALIDANVHDLAKPDGPSRLALVDSVLQKDILTRDGLVEAMAIVAKGADNSLKTGNLNEDSRGSFSELIHKLSETDKHSHAFRDAIAKSQLDLETLEIGFQTTLKALPAPREAQEDVEMEDSTEVEKREQQLDQQLEALSKQTTKETSFFSSSSTSLFNKLSDLFVQICSDKERLAKFTQLPLLKKQSATRDALFVSFFLRLSSSPRAAKARAAALSVVSTTLSETASHRDVDFQAMLPFIIAALSDVSDVVRREAANLLAAFSRTIPKSTHDGPEPASKPWASSTLYESSEQLKSSGWLSARVAHRIVHKGLLPAIEEYILDSNQVSRTIEGVLRGKSESDGDLKKSVRQAFFSFLCAHAVATPVFSVKLRLLAILNRVNKVGSATRTQELSPLLKQWRLVQSDQADQIAADEQLDVKDIDAAVVGIVSNKTADAVDVLMSTVTSQTKSLRPGFIAAVFQRIGQCWGSLKEREVQTSDELLQIALNASLDNDELAGPARETLQTVTLSGPVLVHFLNTIHSTASDMNSPMPAAKRRRTSQNNMVALSLRDPAEVRLLLEKMTFILELVDGSQPEEHPELLGGLFKALGSLHHMKLQMQSEMSYLLSLVLGIMLSIVNKLKETPKAKFDSSLIRADLVIDA